MRSLRPRRHHIRSWDEVLTATRAYECALCESGIWEGDEYTRAVYRNRHGNLEIERSHEYPDCRASK